MTDTPTDRQAVEALANGLLRADIYLGASHVASSIGVNAAATLRALRDKLDAAEAEIARLRTAQGAAGVLVKAAKALRRDAGPISRGAEWFDAALAQWEASHD